MSILAPIGVTLCGCAVGGALANPGPLAFPVHATGFAAPVEIAFASDGSRRLYVVEQAGRIRIVRDGQVLAPPAGALIGAFLSSNAYRQRFLP